MRMMRARTAAVLGALALGLFLADVAHAGAEDRWAVIVSGASGGARYAGRMQQWRAAIQAALVERYRFDPAHVRMFGDESGAGVPAGTAANVRTAIADLKRQAAAGDLVVIVLVGHGTFDGETAKFNLVGPDLTADEWAGLLRDVPGRLVVINTTAASFPFVEALSARGRVVMTATDSAAQKYATVFPEYFVKALSEASTDLDRDGRTSIYELFETTSRAVAQHFEQRGQLATERALLDDTGDRLGRQIDREGPDGALARLLHLDAEHPAATADPELAALLGRRRELEAAVEAHTRRKGDMPEDVWQAEFERLAIELARVSRLIREKGQPPAPARVRGATTRRSPARAGSSAGPRRRRSAARPATA